MLAALLTAAGTLIVGPLSFVELVAPYKSASSAYVASSHNCCSLR